MAIHAVLAVGALALGVAALARGARLVARALRCADDPASSLWLIRGIRGVAVAVAAASLAAGLLSASTGLLAFGLVFLGEELYETGVVALVLRRSDRHGASTPLIPRLGDRAAKPAAPGSE